MTSFLDGTLDEFIPDDEPRHVASRRQRLAEYAESGNLRNILTRTGGPDGDVVDLIVDLCLRYVAPR